MLRFINVFLHLSLQHSKALLVLILAHEALLQFFNDLVDLIHKQLLELIELIEINFACELVIHLFEIVLHRLLEDEELLLQLVDLVQHLAILGPCFFFGVVSY